MITGYEKEHVDGAWLILQLALISMLPATFVGRGFPPRRRCWLLVQCDLYAGRCAASLTGADPAGSSGLAASGAC